MSHGITCGKVWQTEEPAPRAQMEACLVYQKTSQEASVAGAESIRWRIAGDEAREIRHAGRDRWYKTPWPVNKGAGFHSEMRTHLRALMACSDLIFSEGSLVQLLCGE